MDAEYSKKRIIRRRVTIYPTGESNSREKIIHRTLRVNNSPVLTLRVDRTGIRKSDNTKGKESNTYRSDEYYSHSTRDSENDTHIYRSDRYYRTNSTNTRCGDTSRDTARETIPKQMKFGAPFKFTLVMPISGIKFPNQFAIYLHLLKCRYMPDIVCGTSGGSIVATATAALRVSDIKCEDSYNTFRGNLDYVLNELDSSWYSSPLSFCQMFSTCRAVSAGALFDRGNGIKYIKEYAIDLKDQPETWIGTYNRSHGHHQLWCTKSKENSIIRMQNVNYLNEDIDMIAKVTIASSAVPTIVPPVPLYGDDHCDGGVGFASPLGSLMPAFENEQISYHVIYISPVRYSSKYDPQTDEIEDDDVWNKIRSSTAGLVTGLHIADRNNGIRAVGLDPHKEVGEGQEFLMHSLHIHKHAKRSFIELTPKDAVYLNFLNIKKGDALDAVNKAYTRGFIVRHWYIK